MLLIVARFCLIFLRIILYSRVACCVRSSHSPESGISLSHNSLPDSDNGTTAGINGGALHHDRDDIPGIDDGDGLADDSAEFYDVESLPIIGSCRALYSFDGELLFSRGPSGRAGMLTVSCGLAAARLVVQA